jgi:flavin-dependent dehydrogenase
MQAFEVAIVGGGPAGLSTALFLAHAEPNLSDRIVVLEKTHYPREKICAGGIGARGDKLLQRIGVHVDVPSVPVTTLSMRTSSGAASGRLANLGRVVRRVEFDHALAQVTRARGIRVLEDAKVTELRRTPQGVELETAVGPMQARVVIGADGVTGIVRRSLGLGASKYRAQVIELDTEAVAGDLPRDTLHFDYFDPGFTGYAWDFPTIVQGKPLMCRGVYQVKLPGQSGDVQAVLARRLSARGLDIDHYRIKRFAECGFEPHRSYAVPHIALVGEAAGIDTLSGEGIPQAIEYGAFAGKYLAEKLARGEFSFGDWNKRLARAPIGFELYTREWWMRQYFGPRRPMIERYLATVPAFVQCTAEELAGLQMSTVHFFQALATAGVRALASATGLMRERPGA